MLLSRSGYRSARMMCPPRASFSKTGTGLRWSSAYGLQMAGVGHIDLLKKSNLTVVGSPGFNAVNPIGRGYSFDGSTSYMTVAAMPTTIVANPIWLAVSFTINTLPGATSFVLGFGGTDSATVSQYFGLAVSATGQLVISAKGSGATTTAATVATYAVGVPITALLVQASTAQQRLYVNGTLALSDTTAIGAYTSLQRFTIGNNMRNSGGGNLLGGVACTVNFAAYGSGSPTQATAVLSTLGEKWSAKTWSDFAHLPRYGIR